MILRAAIITVGTELTDGRIVDTNASFMATELERRGVRIALSLSVPDDEKAIGDGLRFALASGAALVAVAGGLGPTRDDITAAAIAAAFGLESALNPEAAAMVAEATGASADALAPYQAKQAILPVGATPIRPAGTAPGFILSREGAVIIVLPGVPWELAAQWEEALAAPEAAAVISGAQAPARKALCFYKVGEPAVTQAVDSLLPTEETRIEVSICARYGEVVLEVAYPPEAAGAASELVSALRERFAAQLFSGGEKIEAVIGEELKDRSRTLAVGESCTGGMLGQTITGVSGASEFFLGGVIAYDNEVKKALLKVRAPTLEAVGAVSEAVAQQLAIGARETCGADYGIGVTGIAGPTGGTPEKPVGLVYICVSSAAGDLVRAYNFPSGRDEIRRAAVVAALHLLHRKLLTE